MYSPPLPLARARMLSSSEIEKANPSEMGGLEASLLQLVQQHHQSSLALREQIGFLPLPLVTFHFFRFSCFFFDEVSVLLKNIIFIS